jgi:hypothetical protein
VFALAVQVGALGGLGVAIGANGCSSVDAPPVTSASPGTRTTISGCHEGATQACHVVTGARDGVTMCFDGVATCTGGGWSACGGPGLTRPSDHPPAGSGDGDAGSDAASPRPPVHDPGDARRLAEDPAVAALAGRLERMASGAPAPAPSVTRGKSVTTATARREAREPASSGVSPVVGDAHAAFDRVGGGVVRAALDGVAGRPALARVSLPVDASGFVGVVDARSEVGVRFRMLGTAPAPIAVGRGLAAYAGAVSGAALVRVVTADGAEDFVPFDARPASESLLYEVDVSRAAGLRLVADTFELLDATGTPRLRVAPPYVVDARHRRHPAHVAVEGCAYDRDPRAPWGRPVTAPASSTCTLRVTWGGEAKLPYPLLVDPAWTSTGAMGVRRETHSASVLGTGKVLIAGGRDGGTYHASAELYDPATGTFAATSPMHAARALHFAAAFGSGNGIILVAGGLASGATLSSAETYDGSTGFFTVTGSMATARFSARGTVLSASARVLITGGFTSTAATATRTAEIYDPLLGAFAATGNMNATRASHHAIELPGGAVLVSGGDDGTFLLGSAETYDAASGAFTATGAMRAARARHTGTVLASGKVLLAGSWDQSVPAAYLSSAELYDPATRTFATTGAMSTARGYHVARTLPSGQVIVAGGMGDGGVSATSERYDPAAGTFTPLGPLQASRVYHTGTSLPTGTILLTGGQNAGGGDESSAELLGADAGADCTETTDCASGLCSGGVCCAAACTDTCRTCERGTGACVAVTNAPDPDSCAPPRVCDGASVCVAPTADAGAIHGDAATPCSVNPCDPGCVALPVDDAATSSTLDGGMSYFGSANGLGGTPATFVAKEQCSPCSGAFPMTCGGLTHYNAFDACESDSHCDVATSACAQNAPSWKWPASVCAGADLTVQGSCKTRVGGDVFLVCNRGNTPVASGTSIAFHIVDAAQWATNPNTCPTLTPSCSFTLPSPLVPGGCQQVDTCSWVGDAIVYANALDAVAECPAPTGPGCGDNWANIKAGASCEELTSFTPSAVTTTYVAACPAGSWPHWSLLTYATTVATNASGSSDVRFEAQTAPLNPDGTFGAYGAWHPLADAIATDPEDCNGAPCVVDLFAKLGGKPDVVNPVLSLRVTVSPTPDGARSGSMDSFQVMYSCPASE